VVVLEAHEVGAGGSGRNVGLVNAGLWLKPSEVRSRLGAKGDRLIERLGLAPKRVFDLIERYGIACEASRSGTLHCAVGSSGLANITQRAREWRNLGVAVELLDADETARRVGSRAFRAALLDPRAGTIQPMAYVRGLAAAARAAGAQLFGASGVTSATERASAWHLATARGEVKAGALIVATNAYSEGPFASLREELFGLPYFNFATEPLSETQLKNVLPSRQGIWDSRTLLSSARLDVQGRLIFGSFGALHGGQLKVHQDWAERTVKRLFPDMGECRFQHAWYGTIGMTGDSLPRFHKLGKSAYSISGYNGRGIGPGTSFGVELAQLVSGHIGEGDLSLPLSPMSATPLRRTREKVYELGAAAAHLTGIA
jgi:glycine/D-amino acid oxidase-like deaminating enzyme